MQSEMSGILLEGKVSADGRVVTGRLLQKSRGGWKLIRLYAEPSADGVERLIGEDFRKVTLRVAIVAKGTKCGDGFLSVKVLGILAMQDWPGPKHGCCGGGSGAEEVAFGAAWLSQKPHFDKGTSTSAR